MDIFRLLCGGSDSVHLFYILRQPFDGLSDVVFSTRLLMANVSCAYQHWYVIIGLTSDLESIRFALLGGKILFKNFRYQSSNQSIFVLQGYVVFKFWLQKVNDGERGIDDEAVPSSRFLVYLDGLEWFMHNRTPIYDYIKDLLEKRGNTAPVPPSPRPPSTGIGKDQHPDTDNNASSSGNSKEKKTSPVPMSSTLISKFLLPVDLKIGKGAVVVGSTETPSLLVLHWTRGKGLVRSIKVFSAISPIPILLQSRSPLDRFKLSVELSLSDARLELRTNFDHEAAKNTSAGPVRY